MHSLSGQVVLVVGGSSGIGLGFGRAFAAEGCRVVLSSRRVEALQAAAESCRPAQGAVSAWPCDVTDRLAVTALVARVERELGPVEILVYAAGINVPKRSLAEVAPEDFDRILATNATGAFHCFQAVLPGMRARRSGLIFNIVSVAALGTFPLSGVGYSAAKAAQCALGAFARKEAAADGVRVTNIHPGDTDTPLLEQRPEPPSAQQRRRMLQPADIAALAVAISRLPAHVTVPELVVTPTGTPVV